MCKLHYDIQVLPNLLSLTERVGHEDQVQELVLGGGSQLVVTEVRKSKLFILVDMTYSLHKEVNSVTAANQPGSQARLLGVMVAEW